MQPRLHVDGAERRCAGRFLDWIGRFWIGLDWMFYILLLPPKVSLEERRASAKKTKIVCRLFFQGAAGTLGVPGIPVRASEFAYKGLRLHSLIQLASASRSISQRQRPW